VAAERVAAVRDRPWERLALLTASYAPAPGAPPLHRRYAHAAIAFMEWQLRRGLLDPLGHERPGSPWWRAVNECLLRDTAEARARILGHPGPASSPSVEASVRFARAPTPRTWYLAHNVTIVSAYLDHRSLAEAENRVERFFINLALIRVLYAHALVSEPRLALGWLAPIAGGLGDPRLDMTRMFLSVSRVLPHRYPLDGDLEAYIADEHPLGRLLDVGVIVPRLPALYRWSANELELPGVADLVRDATPAYAWDPQDRDPWMPTPGRFVRAVRWALPAADSGDASPRREGFIRLGRGYPAYMATTRTSDPSGVLRRIGTMVQIEADEVMRFLSSPTGKRFRKVLAAGIILSAPAVFRIPGLRRYPLIRALELIGGAALLIRFAEALRDWERTEEPIRIDLT